MVSPPATSYVGRIAPSPTGYLHLGHARTFQTAHRRARATAGRLIFRMEDLDGPRCRPEFAAAAVEDLRWFGLDWDEGPDIGGPNAPYSQSARLHYYRDFLDRLVKADRVYPCTCSRKEIQSSISAPNEGDEEPVYPGHCRHRRSGDIPKDGRFNWRFRVSDGEEVRFDDGGFGPQSFVAGKHFGDFVVWRHDEVPSYQLAVVTDDTLMGITEVVRGADLLVSTARQVLLYRALDRAVPAFFHCDLIRDNQGVRLAKRHASLSLRRLRENGLKPERLREVENLELSN
jgi:glutamyl-tRNA synthetase